MDVFFCKQQQHCTKCKRNEKICRCKEPKLNLRPFLQENKNIHMENISICIPHLNFIDCWITMHFTEVPKVGSGCHPLPTFGTTTYIYHRGLCQRVLKLTNTLAKDTEFVNCTYTLSFFLIDFTKTLLYKLRKTKMLH